MEHDVNMAALTAAIAKHYEASGTATAHDFAEKQAQLWLAGVRDERIGDGTFQAVDILRQSLKLQREEVRRDTRRKFIVALSASFAEVPPVTQLLLCADLIITRRSLATVMDALKQDRPTCTVPIVQTYGVGDTDEVLPWIITMCQRVLEVRRDTSAGILPITSPSDLDVITYGRLLRLAREYDRQQEVKT